jgi:hypothetical protein
MWWLRDQPELILGWPVSHPKCKRPQAAYGLAARHSKNALGWLASHSRCKPRVARVHPKVRRWRGASPEVAGATPNTYHGWREASPEVASATFESGLQATPSLIAPFFSFSFLIFFICLILRVLYVNFDYKVRVFGSFQVFLTRLIDGRWVLVSKW